MRGARWAVVVLVVGALAATGCGGDPIELCEGCGSPTPTPSITPTPGTPTATPETPTPTPSSEP